MQHVSQDFFSSKAVELCGCAQALLVESPAVSHGCMCHAATVTMGLGFSGACVVGLNMYLLSNTLGHVFTDDTQVLQVPLNNLPAGHDINKSNCCSLLPCTELSLAPALQVAQALWSPELLPTCVLHF